ncbi:MAG: TRAP transporter small permease subunit [Planctomycetes bacterium]|nr:TRAP transporter small permease subunit [Planctomycetota bacterium]
MKKLYHMLNAGSGVVNKILVYLIIFLVCTCTATVFLQVVNRYIIVKISDISFAFTDELSRWLMIIITYAAIGICMREGSMAQVDIIYKHLGPKGRMFLYLMTRTLMAVVLYIGIYYGIRIMNLRATVSSSMLGIPGRLLYSPPVIGSILMAYEWVTELFGVLSGELIPYEAGKARRFPEHEEPIHSGDFESEIKK